MCSSITEANFCRGALAGTHAAIYVRLGKPYAGTVYSECPGAVDWTKLESSVDMELIEGNHPLHEQFTPKLTTAPETMVPFVLAASEGERMIAGDQLYTILGNQSHSNGAFISLLTEGPIGVPIPRHQHERVTELFYCLNGEMQMFAGDGFYHSGPW